MHAYTDVVRTPAVASAYVTLCQYVRTLYRLSYSGLAGVLYDFTTTEHHLSPHRFNVENKIT